MDEQLRVTIAHGDYGTLRSVEESLPAWCSLVTACNTAAELRSAARTDRPDLIISGVVYPDGDGIDACIEIGLERPMPAVIVTARRSMELVTKAMEDHVMAYLIEPVTKEDLEAALIVAWSRFQQLEALEREVGDLREALAARKLIEQAKGVLMAREGLSESDAFARLRTEAQNDRRPMRDVARDIVEAQTID